MKSINVSFSQFAFGLGKQFRLQREASHAWHLHYKKADSVTRQARLQEWIVEHLKGSLSITQQVAERILSTSREKRSKEQQNAYYRAYSDFRYHIVRPETKKPSEVSSQVDVVEKALELVESMTKAQQEKFFKRVSRKK